MPSESESHENEEAVLARPADDDHASVDGPSYVQDEFSTIVPPAPDLTVDATAATLSPGAIAIGPPSSSVQRTTTSQDLDCVSQSQDRKDDAVAQKRYALGSYTTSSPAKNDAGPVILPGSLEALARQTDLTMAKSGRRYAPVGTRVKRAAPLSYSSHHAHPSRPVNADVPLPRKTTVNATASVTRSGATDPIGPSLTPAVDSKMSMKDAFISDDQTTTISPVKSSKSTTLTPTTGAERMPEAHRCDFTRNSNKTIDSCSAHNNTDNTSADGACDLIVSSGQQERKSKHTKNIVPAKNDCLSHEKCPESVSATKRSVQLSGKRILSLVTGDPVNGNNDSDHYVDDDKNIVPTDHGNGQDECIPLANRHAPSLDNDSVVVDGLSNLFTMSEPLALGSPTAVGAVAVPGISNQASHHLQQWPQLEFDIEQETTTATISTQDMAQTPVVAALAPDTDELVQAAILRDRAERDGEKPMLVQSEPVDEQARTHKTRILMSWFAVLCLVAVIVVTTLGVAFSIFRGNSGDSQATVITNTVFPTISVFPSSVPSEAPSMVPTDTPSTIPSSVPSQHPTLSDYTVLSQRIIDAINGSIVVFEDMLSPQSRALQWLVSDNYSYSDGYNVATTGWNATTRQTIIDRYAAAVLYFSLNGEDWLNQASFLSDLELCRWGDIETTFVNNPMGPPVITASLLGVFCAPDSSRPRGFYMDINNNLEGTIPTEIGLFDEMEVFRIRSNLGVTGSIPSEIRRLKGLQVLDVSYNSITGSFGTELLGLSKLTTLDLSSSKFRGNFTLEDGHFPLLRELILGKYRLCTQCNACILKKLRPKATAGSYSTDWDATVPQGLGYLTSLVTLSMDNTKMEGSIPSEIGRLSVLETITMSGCLLESTIPSEMGNLESLISIDFDMFNGLIGGFPTELERLSKLTSLDLGCTKIQDNIPDYIWNMTSLRELDITGTAVLGEVPPGYCAAVDNPFLKVIKCVDVSGPAGELFNCEQAVGADQIKLNCCICPSGQDLVGDRLRNCAHSQEECRREP